MAEEFSAFEKYEKSWRLDHPNFRDVQTTTYAKGVITDFETTSDDPLRVSSRVKVEVEGTGESKFIPLFYHPKELYWDDDGHKATDFNSGGKYFEKAWMSFKAFDEVLVMLRDKVPYAVVGFFEGEPQRGEDIIKCVGGEEDHYARASTGQDYEDGSTGPDGKELDVSEAGVVIADNQTDYSKEYWSYEGDSRGNWWGAPNYFNLRCADSGWWFNLLFTYNTFEYQYRIVETKVVIGPIIYIFQALYYAMDAFTKDGAIYNFISGVLGGNGVCPPNGNTWAEDPANGNWTMLEGADPNNWSPDSITGQSSESGEGYEWTLASFRTKAAVYKEDTKEPQLVAPVDPKDAYEMWEDDAEADWGPQYEGFTDQVEGNIADLFGGDQPEGAILSFFSQPHGATEREEA